MQRCLLESKVQTESIKYDTRLGNTHSLKLLFLKYADQLHATRFSKAPHRAESHMRSVVAHLHAVKAAVALRGRVQVTP